MASVTCLFAAGYKFNFSWPLQFDRLLQKTGTLSVETTPKDAFIFLDGKKQTTPGFKIIKKEYISTPAKIKNLLPDDYTLKIEKENYWPIEKKITIKSGITTFIENINLFRSDLPTIVTSSENSSLNLNNANNKLYLPEANKLIDLNYLNTENLPSSKLNAWINDQEIFIDGKIINTEDESLIDLNSLLKNSQLEWKYDQDNQNIYALLKNEEIVSINSDGISTSSLITIPQVLDYKQVESTLFAIVSQDNKKYFKEYDLNKKEEIKKMELPNFGNYNFFPGSQNGFITLYDKENKSLYLINKNNWQESLILNNIKDWQFIDKYKLIYHNGWEITLLDLDTNISSLISRVSDPIYKITWHEKEKYFIFSTQNSIQAGDLKTNILTTLFKTEKIGDIALDMKNNILYFYAQVGQQSGIYKLMLK
jgi:hypothetical protein